MRYITSIGTTREVMFCDGCQNELHAFEAEAWMNDYFPNTLSDLNTVPPLCKECLHNMFSSVKYYEDNGDWYNE